MRAWVVVSIVGLLGLGCGKAKPAAGSTHSSSSGSGGPSSSSASSASSSGSTTSSSATSSGSTSSGSVSGSGATSSGTSSGSTSTGSTSAASSAGSTGATATGSTGASGSTSASSAAGSTGATGSTGASSSSSGGTTGAVCSNDPGCTQAGDAACDPAGSNQLGACTLGGDGCLHVTGLAACPAASQVCAPGQAACACNPTPACTSGQTQCNAAGTGTETCGTDSAGCAAWVPAQSCTTHQACSATAPGGPGCVCADACTSAGANPDLQCSATASNGYQVCSLDANGCRYWADNTCPGAQVCDASAATAGTNPPCACPTAAVCNPGDERCNPTTGNPELCITGAGGCPTWSQLATCNAQFQQCQLSGNSASCQCLPATGCSGGTLGQTFCPTSGGTTYQTCAIDGATGCFYFTAAQSCPSSQQTCVGTAGNGSQGSCTCPASACNPNNPPTCSGTTDLQSCQLDVANGCGVATATSCASTFGASSTCSTAGGTAHCTCPAPTGSTLVVDSTAGSDVSGNGAASPPACAFKSITKALASTGVGTTYTTISARTGTYNAASGEAFPIQLPAGVTVTTETAPSASAPYVISGSGTLNLTPRGTITAAVVATNSGTSTLQNFTVIGVSNVGTPAYAFACNAGTPGVSGATLGNSDNGAGIFGSCSATLSGVTTRNNGVSGTTVATSGTATLNGQVSDTDANGLRARNGTTTVNVMEVKNATGDGVVLNPSTQFGVNTKVTFGATGMEVHDGAGNGIVVRQGNNGNTPYTGVTVSSSSFHANQGVGIYLQASSPTFSAVQSFDNDNEGVICDIGQQVAGQVATFTNTTVSTNCKAGACSGVALNSGTLNLSGTSGASTSIANNSGDGLSMADGVFNGSGIILSANTRYGALVDAQNGGFTCLNCTVANNQSDGYRVRQAPINNSGVGFKLGPISGAASGGVVTGNGQGGTGRHGVNLLGDTGQVDASLSGVVIGAHTHGAGLLIGGLGGGGFGGNTINAELTSCELTGNGAQLTLGNRTFNAGGAVLVPSGNLSFQGNAVHGNLGNGISVLGGFGAGSLSLDGNACTGATATPNQLYCYGQGNLGVVAYDGIQVSAANELWNQAAPAAGVDFGGATLFTNTAGTVTADSPCGAAANACP